MNAFFKKIALPIMVVGLVACGGSDDDDSAAAVGDIVDVAIEIGNFTQLTDLLTTAGLVDTLKDPDAKFTVFAPTDEAFAKLDPALVATLTQAGNEELLKQVLTYHVVAGEVDSVAAFEAVGSKVGTLSGDVAVSSVEGDLFINLSKVVTPDVDATNGIIHAIDTVLIPVGLGEEAPTLNIVDTAVAAGNFTTLEAALGATNLVSTLSNPEGSFTVFAPTDDAFAKLGQETIDALIADPATLTKILLKHVVAGSVDSVTALTFNGLNVPTLNTDGETLALDIFSGDDVFVNDSQITTFDIQTTNGIIHVIDSVILLDLPDE